MLVHLLWCFMSSLSWEKLTSFLDTRISPNSHTLLSQASYTNILCFWSFSIPIGSSNFHPLLFITDWIMKSCVLLFVIQLDPSMAFDNTDHFLLLKCSSWIFFNTSLSWFSSSSALLHFSLVNSLSPPILFHNCWKSQISVLSKFSLRHTPSSSMPMAWTHTCLQITPKSKFLFQTLISHRRSVSIFWGI